jgi:lysozyme
VLISQQGLDLIKHFEAFSPTVYICAAGWPTIGWGHVVLKSEDFSAGITQAQGEELLAKDVERMEHHVLRLTPANRRILDQGQFDALVSFAFNLGQSAYERSTLRQCVLAGHDDLVPDQFMRWVYGGGRKLKGLIRRRAAEAKLYMLEGDHALAA